MSARGWATVMGAFVMLSATRADAYAVSFAKSLDELAKSADLVVKGKVVSDVAVNDPWFDRVSGFEAREAELTVVSVIKGAAPAGVVHFRHYAPTPGPTMYAPSNVTLTLQRTYVVFAANAGGGIYRQLTKDPSVKSGEGVTLAGDEKPHRGKAIADIVWAEHVALLASKAPDDVVTAIHEIDERSGGHRSGLTDFARKPALDAIRPLTLATSADVQATALAVFGTQSPYTDDAQAPFWLAGAGKGVIAGMGPLPVVKNTDADVAAQELTAIADGKGQAAQRALAIRALGRTAPTHAASIARWFKDAEPEVRRAAVLLAADVPDTRLIAAAATDPSERVRHGAARAVGFAQAISLLPTLGTLLKDPDLKVRTAAALSLLSFSPDDAGPVMKANLASDYRSLFVNALARKDASPYLAELADVIEKDGKPGDWWGGTIPAGDSWSLLFGHVKKQPAADIKSGKLDRSLDALEKMRWFGSSEPRDLYALYVLHGLGARAKRFRAVTRKSVTYDIDQYFDMADKSPATYVQP